MNKLIEELVIDFLYYSYPITRLRVPNKFSGPLLQNNGLKTKGNFKRTIIINTEKIFKISESNDKNLALYNLSNIVCRVFNISIEESTPIIKKYLHIK